MSQPEVIRAALRSAEDRDGRLDDESLDICAMARSLAYSDFVATPTMYPELNWHGHNYLGP